MILISIDPGTYSLKYQITKHSKKEVSLVDAGEVILQDHLSEAEEITFDLYAQIIEEIKESFGQHGKIAILFPTHFTTTRFFTLPVKNKKKAEQMIPFQLEEDLPYSAADIHFASILTSKANQTEATVSIVQKDIFQDFLSSLKEKNIYPNILTSPISILRSSFKESAIDQNSCILDLGHNTSEAYFFKDGNIVSLHISYIGGKTINEAIAKAYNIELEEAIKYKHTNSFLLTEEQLEEVNDSQRKFATLMDEVLSPLISDLKKWELGYRITQHEPIEHIYLLGGCSQIKNINSYLVNKLQYPVSFLSHEINPSASQDSESFFLLSSLPPLYPKRNQLLSFLKGEFVPQNREGDLPLYSISFLFTRIAILSILLILSLGVQRFFINKRIQSYDKKIVNLLRTPELNLSPRERRRFRRTPQFILNKLNQERNRIRSQEIALDSMKGKNSLSALASLSKLSRRYHVKLERFTNNTEGQVLAIFTAKTEGSTSLSHFKTYLENSGLPELKATLNPSQDKLSIRYYGGVE